MQRGAATASEHVMVAGSRRRWATIGALLAVTLPFGLDAAATAAEKPTLTIDQRKVQYQLDDAVSEVSRACAAHVDEDLEVIVREPTYDFSVDIVCSAGLAMPDTFIRAPLVKQASRHQDAGKRARAVGDAYEALPPVDRLGYDYDGWVWSIAARDPGRCRKAESRRNIQDNMRSSVEALDSGESPAHWTLVEAFWALGMCPDRLPALYENVAALGNPIAARTVERIMARSPVRLPLDSVPHGVSPRAVGGRPVFLVRDGRHVTTFLTDVHHLPGEKTLLYCPTERVFASPTHAEVFDEAGAIVGGPAQRGLDRFKTTIAGDTVTVHLKDIIRGSTAHDESLAPAAAAASAGPPWNTGPGSFCFQEMRNSITAFG
jgi:hypothetical protein